MKNLFTLLCLSVLFVGKARAQSHPAGYMGLFDMNVSAGYENKKDDKTFPPSASFQNVRTNGAYILGHFQESLLCNYFWQAQQDQKVKVGFQETIDFGVSRQSVTTSGSTDTGPEIQNSQFFFHITYEAAFAGVYRINDDMDAGFTYCVFALSTFNDARHFARFRFRYAHFMGELTAFGKTAIDFKYLIGNKDNDRSGTKYIGFSYTGHSESIPLAHEEKGAHYVHVSYGYIF
jgi:hypothetical protein